jgi:hypothetical protein
VVVVVEGRALVAVTPAAALAPGQGSVEDANSTQTPAATTNGPTDRRHTRATIAHRRAQSKTTPASIAVSRESGHELAMQPWQSWPPLPGSPKPAYLAQAAPSVIVTAGLYRQAMTSAGPPDAVRFDLEEPLELLAALEDARDALTDS